MLCDENRVKDLYHPDFLKKALAKQLFVTGIDPKALTPNCLQFRFQTTLSDGRIVFYPTLTTSAIFNQIRLYKNTTRYLTSCKGIGKSFSLALFVYLHRQRKNTRVFYVQNSYIFAESPIDYFVRELFNAFREEITSLGFSKEHLLQMLYKNLSLKPGTPFQEFLSQLFNTLEKNGTRVFVIFDQVNELSKIKDQAELSLQIYDYMRDLPIRCTSVLMSFTTNEDEQKAKQERSLVKLDWKEPLREVVDKYILDRFHLDLKNPSHQVDYEKINAFAGGYFLILFELAHYVKGHRNATIRENILDFTREKRMELASDIEKFLEVDEVKDPQKKEELRTDRRRAMGIILYSIAHDVEVHERFTNEYDAKHFIYIEELKKYRPVHNLIMTSYT